ncbi:MULTISPECIES: glycoside hydrolase family 9 protein [Paenibacillus]|nr:glycoside hydrolase family 9 protein [Paenibacillus anaericanus]
MKILMNHIGYARCASKHAVIIGQDGDEAGKFRIVEGATGSVVYSGTAVNSGPVNRWKDWYFWTLDFDSVQEEGSYYIECDTSAGNLRSYEFLIKDNLLGIQSLSDVIFYFKAQRCTGDFDRADHHIPFAGDRKGRHDLHGGWYDATGDYGKHLSHQSHTTYFNPQQGSFTAWVLFKAHELLEDSGNPRYFQFKRRIMDEAMYGADYMYRMMAPSGTFFRSVKRVGEFMKAEDRVISFQYKGSSTQFGDAATAGEEVITDESYETGFRQGAGFAIAALAAASRYSYPGDYTREQYLEAAKEAYSYLEENNHRYLNDGRSNILDEYCTLTALTELYKASLEPDYLKKAGESADRLLEYLHSSGDWKDYWSANDEGRPFFHPSDAGLPAIALLNYLEIEKNKDMRAKVLETVKKAMQFELGITKEVSNPFGLARQLVQSSEGSRYTAFFLPHQTEASPWWQGENARLASLAAAARLLSKHLDEQDNLKAELQVYADHQLNWILGLNPYDSCMLQGSGRNNPEYHFVYGFDYMNCPGGICNGITGDPSNEEGIEFFTKSIPGVIDDNWRWGEQWLPHASWYMYAVALGDLN